MNSMPEIIINNYTPKIIINNTMFDIVNEINLGPAPQMIRSPPQNDYEEALIFDGSFKDLQNTPNEFEMPYPCVYCHTLCCDASCSEEKEDLELVKRHLHFENEEEMPLPPPRALTNSHLPDDDEEEFQMPEDLVYVSFSFINK